VKKFSTALSDFIRRSETPQSKIAEKLGISEAWLIDLKKGRRKPPSPAKTRLYPGLDKIFDQPPGTFEALALQEIHGADHLRSLAPFMFADRGHLAGEQQLVVQRLQGILEAIDRLEPDRRLRVLKMLEDLAALPDDTLGTLEALVRPLLHAARGTRGKDGEEGDE